MADELPEEISQLQAELDHLKQHLDERDVHIANYESEFLKCNSKNTELEEQVSTWREKYERLYEAHKRVQRVNQNLEDKVLDMVDKCKGEKAQLTKDIAVLSVRLAESKHSVTQLQLENERYKNDMTLAIQLLQCKPDNFVMQKFDALPLEMQNRVLSYVSTKTKLSPASLNSNNNANGKNSRSGSIDERPDLTEYEFSISASLMSKILEDSIHDTVTKHCDSCSCSKDISNPFSYGETHYTVATQTYLKGELKNSLCLNCNGDIKSLNSNLSIRSDSPLAVKIFNNGTDTGSLSEKEMASPVYLVRVGNEKMNNKLPKEPSVNMCLPNEGYESPKQKSKHVPAKHRGIITRIGNELNELLYDCKFDPLTGHHLLCDKQTEKISSADSLVTAKDASDLHNSNPIIDLKSSLDNLESVCESMPKSKSDLNLVDNKSRKTSSSSNDAASKASSTSTHKSNTHVGPGPRFCSLRVQAGSKNILLDNAQPDVPPVLYKRQLKHNDTAPAQYETSGKNNFDESFHVECDNTGEKKVECESTPDNKVLDAKPLDKSDLSPLNEKHVLDFSVPNDLNIVSLLPIPQNASISCSNLQNTHSISDDVIIFINEDTDKSIKDVNKNDPDSIILDPIIIKSDIVETASLVADPASINDHGIKVFNFDNYEKESSEKALNRKVEIAQLNQMQNTKLSKSSQLLNQFDIGSELLDKNYNVQLASKHFSEINKGMRHKLQVNKNGKPEKRVAKDKKTEITEKSTSSISSEDSATVLQKQQLIRVAEWVQKNIEMSLKQENSPGAESADSFKFNSDLRQIRKVKNADSYGKFESLPLKMPHPVTKYSDTSVGKCDQVSAVKKETDLIDVLHKEEDVLNKAAVDESVSEKGQHRGSIVTIFENIDVQGSDVTQPVAILSNDKSNMRKSKSVGYAEDCDSVALQNEKKDLSQEELARMEYNVKQFLLKGSNWTTNIDTGLSRIRRTSSHTETDL